MDIMIVDDDDDDIALFCEAVWNIDSTLACATAQNGLEALANLKKFERLPKVIFLDVNMPLMDGRETLDAIQQNPAYASICIVMFSTTQNPYEIAEYTKVGVDFVIKPNDYNELLHLIGRYLTKAGLT